MAEYVLYLCLLTFALVHNTVATDKKAEAECAFSTSTGSCVAAGYKNCCQASSNNRCLGKPTNAQCHCDSQCHILKDCCPDVHKIGCQGGPLKRTRILRKAAPKKAVREPTPQSSKSPVPLSTIKPGKQIGNQTPRPSSLLHSGTNQPWFHYKNHHFIILAVGGVILLGILLILICQAMQCVAIIRTRSKGDAPLYSVQSSTMTKKGPSNPEGKAALYSTVPETDTEENIYGTH